MENEKEVTTFWAWAHNHPVALVFIVFFIMSGFSSIADRLTH